MGSHFGSQESLNARVVKASWTATTFGCRRRDHTSMLEKADCCIRRKSEKQRRSLMSVVPKSS